jgi:hypothetical protein
MTEHKDIQYTYQWKPTIRITLVDGKGHEYQHPAIGPWLADLPSLYEQDGVLTAKQCKALWKYLKRHDKPPAKLWIMLNREDLMRMFPPLHS